MGSASAIAESSNAGPVAAADTTNLTGTIRVLLTGANQSFALGSTMGQRWARLAANTTDDVQYAYGIGAAATLTYNQASAAGTGHVASGETLFSKTSDQHVVPPGATHISFRSSSTNGGYFEFGVREGRR